VLSVHSPRFAYGSECSGIVGQSTAVRVVRDLLGFYCSYSGIGLQLLSITFLFTGDRPLNKPNLAGLLGGCDVRLGVHRNRGVLRLAAKMLARMFG
jgi:hypothetical protein